MSGLCMRPSMIARQRPAFATTRCGAARVPCVSRAASRTVSSQAVRRSSSSVFLSSVAPRMHSRTVQTRAWTNDESLHEDKPNIGAGLLAAMTALSILMGSGLGSMALPASAAEAVLAPEPPITMKMPVDAEDQGLSSEEQSTIKVYQRSTPSVVNVSNIRTIQRSRFTMDLQKMPVGQGSGFVWDKQGHVVTNYHVIKGASDLSITLLDNSSWPAKVVGADPEKDVAVLQLLAPPEKIASLQPVAKGKSGSLLVGQRVYAIGNPFGLDHTMTQGIISGVGRELNTGFSVLRNVIQTDAAINPGNSGGVLLDSKGYLIGINTAIADPGGKGSSSGVGFAIPIDTVEGLVGQILEYGRTLRPTLGVTIAPPQILQQLSIEGALILDVNPDSPAAKAGLLPTTRDRKGTLVLGDVILSLGGKPVKSYSDLFAALDEQRAGNTVPVELLRDGQRITVEVTLQERAVGRVE